MKSFDPCLTPCPPPLSASQGSFPGNLHLVLVLRPTTLFQRTLSDFLFKFNKDEFKMKVRLTHCTTSSLGNASESKSSSFFSLYLLHF